MQLELRKKSPKHGGYKTPLLFVHGAWHGAWCWDEYYLDWFARQGYAAHALSLRGHGHSEGADKLRWSSLDDFVADVAQVAGGLDEAPVVIGHSMGGLVVQKYLAAHAVPAAVLLASVPPQGILSATLKMARRHPLLFAKANSSLSLYPLVSTAELARELFFSSTMPKADVQRYAEQLGDESYRAFLDMLGLSLPRPRRLGAPLLVLGGIEDAIFTIEQVRATARAYHTEAELFSGMAHDMMLEPGWKKVAQRIVKFLADQDIK